MTEAVAQKQRRLYSRMKPLDWMLSLPPNMREPVIVPATGTSMNYLLRKSYTYADYVDVPHFKLRIAVGLDKASNGICDFRDLVADGHDIDWRYVHKVLGKRLREEKSKQLSDSCVAT